MDSERKMEDGCKPQKRKRNIDIPLKKSREIGKRSVGDGNSCKDEKKVEDSLEVIQISGFGGNDCSGDHPDGDFAI